MFIFGICLILYFRKPSVATVGCTKGGSRYPPDSDFFQLPQKGIKNNREVKIYCLRQTGYRKRETSSRIFK